MRRHDRKSICVCWLQPADLLPKLYKKVRLEVQFNHWLDTSHNNQSVVVINVHVKQKEEIENIIYM